MVNATTPGVHVVVFDINVYLDVASLLGPPVTWEKFDAAAAQFVGEPVPASDRRVDSLRAIALATTGRLAGPDQLEVWTSDHIDAVAWDKTCDPLEAAEGETTGLGWVDSDADTVVDRLIYGVVFDRTEGGSVGETPVPYGTPPLDHEDGCVYETIRSACADRQVLSRYCVTNDRAFREAELPGDISVLYAYEWINLVRSARSLYAARTMCPAPPP